jgi:glycosyltransferase involved in cell wall biosynthesis
LVLAGLPEEKIHLKPHFYPDPPIPLPWIDRDLQVVFIGRLGDYKGVHLLVDAWKKWRDTAPLLEIIGEGPERSGLEKKVSKAGLSKKIRFWGQLHFADTQAVLARTKLLVLPTLCFEGFPMAVREALALGVPVAASRLGSLACLVEEGKNGVLFEPDDPTDLYRSVKGLWESPERLEAMAIAARNDFEQKYTSEKNHKLLMDIYNQAIQVRTKQHFSH